MTRARCGRWHGCWRHIPIHRFAMDHEAIEVAARALERSAVKGSALWDTLAAAYAEAGQFADAVLTAQRALRAAQQESRPDLVKAIQIRTRLYETEMPFREAPTVIH